MKKEELLKPRYKVIADYPDSAFDLGEIVTQFDSELFKDSFGNYFDADLFPKYPHLFKKLEWWEERHEGEMPMYVRGVKGYFNGKVYRVADPSQNGRMLHNDGEIEHQAFVKYASDFIPITEEEYNEYIKNHTP